MLSRRDVMQVRAAVGVIWLNRELKYCTRTEM